MEEGGSVRIFLCPSLPAYSIHERQVNNFAHVCACLLRVCMHESICNPRGVWWAEGVSSLCIEHGTRSLATRYLSLHTHTKTYHRAQRMLETQLAAKKD